MTGRRKVAVVEPSGIHMFDILGSAVKWKRFVADAVTPDYVGAGDSTEPPRLDSTSDPAPTSPRTRRRRG